MSEHRLRTLLMGALIGAGVGLVAAWVVTDARREEQHLLAQGVQADVHPSARDWVKFGVAAVTLLRQLADILSPRKR